MNQTRGKIAIARGHWMDSGADSEFGASECQYNDALAYELRALLVERGFSVYLHNHVLHGYGDRQDEFREATENYFGGAPDFAIELHYNASDSADSHGFEYLALEGCEASERNARILADNHKFCFPWQTARREAGVLKITRNENGGGFLYRFRDCGAVLVESFFGTNQDEMTYFSRNMTTLAGCLSESIEEILTK